VEIRAPRGALFDLAQDYYVRTEWDPFLREMRFLDGATEAAPGVRVRVRAKNGLSMEVEYVTVARPERVAVRITRGPFFFENFAGSWLFQDAGGGVTRWCSATASGRAGGGCAPSSTRRSRRCSAATSPRASAP
jgi:hypothetical protein